MVGIGTTHLVILLALVGAGTLLVLLRRRLADQILLWYTQHGHFFSRPMLTVGCVGLALSLASLLIVAHQTEIAAWRDFEPRAQQMARLVESRLDGHIHAVEGVAALFAARPTVTRTEFETFAKKLLESDAGLVALGYIPRISGEQRADFEAAASADRGTDVYIKEIGPDRSLIRRAIEDAYFPVLYLEPLLSRGGLLGFDFGSNPTRRDALVRARDTGGVAVSSGVRLLDSNAVLLVAPVYESPEAPSTVEARRAALSGFTVTATRLGNLLGGGDTSIQLAILNRSGQTVFSTDRALSPAIDHHYEHQFAVGDQTWVLNIEPEAQVAGLMEPQPWLIAAAVLSLALLLAYYMGSQRQRERQVERLVVERTMKYARANSALEEEMAERQRMQEHLVQSQKMEAIGQLTGGIAHDFNNLLMIVDGYARRAEKAVGQSSKAHDALLQVIAAAEKAAKLTKQLLVFSRRQAMEKRVFRVSEALREAESLLERSVGKDCQLKMEFGDESLCVHSDAGELTQAVLHLAGNAGDAMQRGDVTIRTRSVVLTDEDVRDIDGIEPGDFVEISVTDTGSGISEEDRLHIFEPFYTTKDQGKGTGLGLAMVLGFAQQSGGTVLVETSANEGTTMRVLLPQAAGGAQEAAATVGDECRGRGETVLVVEDDEALLALNSETLRELGYKVLTAEDGFCALEVEEECEGEIDLLLSDVVMPQMGGFELCEIIREKRPGLPTVFVSGYPNRDSAKGTKMPENCQFLQKPVTPGHLAKAIRTELDSPRANAPA